MRMIEVEASEGVLRKGTVIMLHGWAQNAKVMHHKSLTLTRKLKNAGYDVVFLEATIGLPMTSTIVVDGQTVEITNGKRPNAKAWFVYNDKDYCDASEAQNTQKYINYIGIDQSINAIKEFLQSKEFSTSSSEKVALFGFSQGGTFIHLISTILAAESNYNSSSNADVKDTTTKQDNNNNTGKCWTSQICCVICAGAFPAKHCPTSDSEYYKYRDWFVLTGVDNNDNDDSTTTTTTKTQPLLKIPSLHVIGQKDTSVIPSKSHDLADLFRGSEIYYHTKGHLISQNSASCRAIITFLSKHFCEKKRNENDQYTP